MPTIRYKKRGFTLVELMIVVAIIGVLASLAIMGVTKYLASAKSGEAKSVIGGITRGAVGAYEKEIAVTELVPDGQLSSAFSRSLCNSADARVPLVPPAGKKYQPSTAVGADFKSGSTTHGWQCLRFIMTEPIHFSYMYERGAGKYASSSGATAQGFEVSAEGDLNGNGVYSVFARGADVRNGSVVVSTTLYVDKEGE